MLDKHLIAQIRPLANEKNVLLWENYRITVLQDGLFRLERSENRKFRDEATQSVWFRDMPAQNFGVEESAERIAIATRRCKLIVRKAREDCRVEINGERFEISNAENLKGTYRTLDCCDGERLMPFPWAAPQHKELKEKIELEDGVCSKNGVAVFDDVASLTLGQDGEIKPVRGDGSDEYIFVYGKDYRAAVKALYLITGNVPLIPRFALGNWWSRYYVYTDKTYLKLLNSFAEKHIPLTVATIDMDWHYSTQMEADLHITEKGRNTPFYGGNDGWTGYTWNKRLFPDYRAFLKKIEAKNLKITLNLHPAGGVRWWEDAYEDMARALGKDPETGEWIQFDLAQTDFINAYFKYLHKPYEKDGVAFWWIDWQQGVNSGMGGLDYLWALNHYHYLDNASNHSSPLILSRYCGVGSHRYPLGFSGDTLITWKTLDYLPYFTATASNVGYTWWSHDIGGHMMGEKNDELYVRHIQYGVFSPINRLHSSNAEVCTKEPWAYGNGAGGIAEDYLRLRHRLIPYLYTASYRTYKEGVALVEPLYYEWKDAQAYSNKNEYLFGSELLVIPVTQAAETDGYARVQAWLPEGVWTNIFTGEEYEIGAGGAEKTLYCTMENMPVLAKQGAVLPLSADKGNSCKNPETLEVWAYRGNGEYTLYEDGKEENKPGELHTAFRSEYAEKDGVGVQTLTICGKGDCGVIPANRTLRVRFKNIPEGEVCVYENGEKTSAEEILTDCAAADICFKEGVEYRIEVRFALQTALEKVKARILRVLLTAEGDNEIKNGLWNEIKKQTSEKECLRLIEESEVSAITKLRLK